MLKIVVAYSPAARTVETFELELPEGADVAAALDASDLLDRYPALRLGPLHVGVWGRACSASWPLADGDRVEVYRELSVDPKEARRLRGEREKLQRRAVRPVRVRPTR